LPATNEFIEAHAAYVFCKHFFANLIVTKDNMHIDPELVDKYVTLRMNKVFMKFLRENKCCGLINLIAGITNEILENEDEKLWS